MTQLLIVGDCEDKRTLLKVLLEANGYRVAFADGGVEALARELEDTIAQLKEAKRKLQESEGRFRSLTEMSSDFYWESDAEHRLVQRTSADSKLSSVSVFRMGAQIGERRWDIPYLSPDAAGWAAHQAVLDAHLPFRDFELSRLGVDGIERFIWISGDPVFDAAGAFEGYRGVGTDITERKRAEEEIRALARFPSENPSPVLRVGRDGVLLYANESSRVLLAEWSCAVGQPVPPFWLDLAAEALDANSQRTLDVEIGDQTYAFVVAPVSEGEYVNLYGSDITERKRLEATLKSGEALLKDMGHMAAVGGWEFDLVPPEHPWDHLQQRWTEEIYRILEVDENYSPTVGKSIAFYAPASKPIIERAVKRAIADGTPFDLELELITAKGNLRWVHAIGKADREFGKIVGTFRDITERKQDENALFEAKERYRFLVEASNDVIWSVDSEGRISFMNAASRRVYGREPEEMIGRHFLDFVPPDLHAIEQAFFAEKVQSGSADIVDYENSVYHKDGSILVVSANAHIVRDEDGRFLGCVGSSRDITALKRSEQTLRENLHQLRQLQDSQARLSRDLHDDTIQSIYAVGMGLERIQRLITKDADKAKTELSDAVSQLNEVIRRVREQIVGMEGNVAHPGQLYVELDALLHALSSGYRMQFELDASPNALAALFPNAGYEAIGIVREAVSNSLRHSGGTQGLVSLSERKGGVLLAIEDNGIGFDVLNPPRSGQGLRNIAARAQLLGAQLAVRSSPGEGTHIVVEIPEEGAHVGD